MVIQNNLTPLIVTRKIDSVVPKIICCVDSLKHL